MSFCFEEPLDFNGGHATGAGGRDRLTIDTVLHVAGVKDAFDVGPSAG